MINEKEKTVKNMVLSDSAYTMYLYAKLKKSKENIKNGEVIMMNEKDLDRLIYDAINGQKGNNTERIIEEVSKKSLINYLYLYKKVRKIIVE